MNAEDRDVDRDERPNEPSRDQPVRVPQHVLDRLQAIKRRVLDRIAEREHKTPDPQQERNEP